MAKRIQLSEEDLDNVTGGSFNFYSRDGKVMCYVQGVGTFYCSDDASSWIISQITGKNGGDQAIVTEALDKGLFWQ